jgi:hypothetical protein
MLNLSPFFLTICLIFSGNLLASDNLAGPPLDSFKKVAEEAKAIPFDNQQICQLSFEELKINSEDPKEIMEAIVEKLKLNDMDLMEKADFFASTGFKNVTEVIDNSYCFPFLGSKIKDSEDRKNLINSYKSISEKVQLFLYFHEDINESSIQSKIYMFLKDVKSAEVYALKSNQKIE